SMSSSKSAPHSELAHAIVKIFLTMSVASKVTAHRSLLNSAAANTTQQPQGYDFSVVLGLRLQDRQVAKANDWPARSARRSAASARAGTPCTTLQRQSCRGS